MSGTLAPPSRYTARTIMQPNARASTSRLGRPAQSRSLHASTPRSARVQRTHYETLGIAPDAAKRDIKNRFYELSKKNHPDLGGNREKFEDVSEAYSVLGDDAKRRQYDNSLNAQHQSSRPAHAGPSHYYRPPSPYLRRDRASSGPHRSWSRPPPNTRAPPGPDDAPPGYHFTASRRARQPPNFGSASFNTGGVGAGPRTGGFGRRAPGGGGPYQGGGPWDVGGGGASGSGGFGGGADPEASEEVRAESGVLRFVGVFMLVMAVVGLGGGFTVRAEERAGGADGETWRSDAEEAERT